MTCFPLGEPRPWIKSRLFLFASLSVVFHLLLGDTQSLVLTSSSSSITGQYQDLSHLPHKNCSGTVDGETILNCKVEFPGDGKWIPYTFKWTKYGASKPLFFRFPGYPPHLEASYENRVRMTVSAKKCIVAVALSGLLRWNGTQVVREGKKETEADAGAYFCLRLTKSLADR